MIQRMMLILAFSPLLGWASCWLQQPVSAPAMVGPADDGAQLAGGDGRPMLRQALADSIGLTTAGQYCGGPSCMATACHGRALLNPSGQPYRGGEYFQWLEHDPHARASLTLQQPRSTAMLRQLGIQDEQGRIVDQRQYENCLRCHGLPAADAEKVGEHPAEQGVSCEACHGPSSLWKSEHHLAGWRTRSAQERRRLGFVATDEPLVRAAVCATCHVGGPDRQVNHDLIAAGHPALRFDYASYYRRLPKHWAPPAAESQGDFELTQWVVGTIASSRAALAQLDARARGQDAWPELSELQCFACHHDLLADGAWPKASTSVGRMTPWTWYETSMQRVVAPLLPDAAAEDWRRALQWRISVLEQAASGKPPETPHPPPSLQADVVLSRPALLGSLQDLVREGSPLRDWETAAQVFLALDALGRDAERDGRPEAALLREKLESARAALRFPPNYNSPRDPRIRGAETLPAAPAEEGPAESPESTPPEQLATLLEDILQLLTR